MTQLKAKWRVVSGQRFNLVVYNIQVKIFTDFYIALRHVEHIVFETLAEFNL
jgi:hypothetical protein